MNRDKGNKNGKRKQPIMTIKERRAFKRSKKELKILYGSKSGNAGLLQKQLT